MQYVRGEFITWTHTLALVLRNWPDLKTITLSQASGNCDSCESTDGRAAVTVWNALSGAVATVCFTCLYDGAFPEGEERAPEVPADAKIAIEDEVERYAFVAGVQVNVLAASSSQIKSAQCDLVYESDDDLILDYDSENDQYVVG